VIGLTGKRADGGSSVLLFALALMFTVVSAVTTLTLLAVRTAANSGTFRNRGAAISAAEGQVDVMVSRISAAVTADRTAPSWPCTPITSSIADSGRQPISATTTVTYYDVNGTDLGCPSAGMVVRSATVRGVATVPSLADALPVRRVMEAVLNFTGGDPVAVPVFALPRSMFSQDDVLFTNSVTVTRAPGADLPSVYTNGNFSCANSTSVDGDVFAQGGVSMANSCTVGGSLGTGGAVNATSGQARVGGNIVAAGDVTVNGGGRAVGGTIRTAGLAGWSDCTSTRCTSNDPTVTPPPAESLPDLPWNADVEAAWVRSGWTVVKFEDPADCTTIGGTNVPGQWLQTNSLIAGPKTVVRTICPLLIGNNAAITMARDIAVVADGGTAFNNSMRFNAATQRSLYIIQPTSTPSGCATGGITFNNHVSFQSTISLMLFTPCDIVAAQSLDVTGQFYAGGRLSFSNSVTLRYRPMRMPIPSSSSTTVDPYELQVTAKRENQ
jgi:hypothetical protein